MKTEKKFNPPSMLLRTEKPGGFIRANPTFIMDVGFSEEELSAESFLHWIHPDDVSAASQTMEGNKQCCQVRHRTRSGDYLTLSIRKDELFGEPMILARGTTEAVAEDGPSDEEDQATVIGTLHTIARILEEQNPGFKCSILLVADGKFVRGAGPSLPEDYNAAIDGFSIGPTVGSCGTAIYWNVPVIVEDIQNDPLWADLAQLAQGAGVAACWSHPFASKNGTVLGALAFYSPEPKHPTQEQFGRLKAAAQMTGLAVERGRAEEALREQRQREIELEGQLRQAAKMEALGVLAGGIAHDFNNVLATILANAEYGTELLPADSVIHENLADIITASKRASQFCQRMLDYAGRGALTKHTIEIGALIPEINNLVLAAISKKISLEYNLLDQDVFVEGDEGQLLQVFMNLVTNAAEAIGESSGRIVVSSQLVNLDEDEAIRLDPKVLLAPGEYLQLNVWDNGPGIEPDVVSRMFDPFFSTKDNGHGLGLSAVKGIVNRHGGVIQIHSEKDQGTTFTIILPTVEHVPSHVEKDKPASSEPAGKTVLVADDESALREIICRKLHRIGYQTLEAVDGQMAVEVFGEHQDDIDCVLLDFSMPKLNGEEAQRAIHALRENVPIIIMSGFSEQEVVDRFRGAGIAGILQKPVSVDVLMKTIKEAMA